ALQPIQKKLQSIAVITYLTLSKIIPSISLPFKASQQQARLAGMFLVKIYYSLAWGWIIGIL
ncbi:MAG: hypothetical protein ACJ71H_02825, partial [Nitrososphaeraceae archaeon]